jgi:hypothetical protein
MLTGRLPIDNVDVVNGVRRAEKTQKSKLEIRNSKQIQMINKNKESNKGRRLVCDCFRILFEFRFVSDFELRISNFALALAAA